MAAPSGKPPPYELNRSCERCRGLKIRCLRADSDISSTCQRCIRLNLECVYARPATRRPHKKTDAKVAELEKEVRLLSSILRRQYESPASSTFPASVTPQAPQQQQNQVPVFVGTSSQQETSTDATPASDPDRPEDLIQSGLVSYELAQDIFRHFTTKTIPCFPVLAFAADVEMEDVRTKRPMLFLSILANGCNSIDPILAPSLHEKLASFLAVRSMVARSSPSLDLLQALLVTTFWFQPGEKFDDMKYQQYTYIAAGIASQITERSKFAARRKAAGAGSSVQSSNESSPAASGQDEIESMELPRTLISCFVLCSGISRSLHRPSMFPFTKRINECIRLLASSAIVQNDRFLVLWAQQQHIMCESIKALGVDDPSVDVDITESRTQQILETYDNQLEAWHSKSLQYSEHFFISFIYHSNRACLHEIALYCDYDPDDFKPPFAIEKLSPLELEHVEWTAAHVRSISLCWNCACKALDLFLETPVDLLRPSPNVIFIRMVYCTVLMLKVSASAKIRSKGFTLGASHGQEYPLYRVTSYIDRCVPHLQAICQVGRNPMAKKLSFALGKMKDWAQRHDANETLDTSEETLLEPLQDLSLDRTTQNSGEAQISNAIQKSAERTENADQLSGNPQSAPSLLNSAISNVTTDPSSSFIRNEGQLLSASQLQSQWQPNDFFDFGATQDLDLQLSPSFFQEHDFDLSSAPQDNQGIFDWADF